MDYTDKQLVRFKKEIILIGPRDSIHGFYNMLLKLGCEGDKTTTTSFKDTVLFLSNEGLDRYYPCVKVLKKTWWEYYHKPIVGRTPRFKTYDIPRQWQFVCDNFLVLTDKPLLIPDVI